MGWSLCDLGWFHYDIVNSRAGLAQAGGRDEVLAHWDYHCHRLMTWPGPGLPWYIAAALWPGPGPNIANLIRHTRITVSPSSSPSPCREQVQCTWPQWRCCFITSTDFPPRRVSILKLNQRVKYFYYQFNYPGPSKHYLWYFWRCMERQGRVLKMNYLWDLWCILWDSRVLQKTFMKNRFAFKIYLSIYDVEFYGHNTNFWTWMFSHTAGMEMRGPQGVFRCGSSGFFEIFPSPFASFHKVCTYTAHLHIAPCTDWPCSLHHWHLQGRLI